MTVRARIRAAIQGGLQAPQEISAAVIADLPDSELRAALTTALPLLVRDEIRKFRHDAIGDRTGSRGEPSARWKSTETGQFVTNEVAERAQQRRESGQKAADASQATRDRNAELLRTPIAVGKGQWKALGECTPDDLRAVARMQSDRAAENQRRADGFLRLAEKLEAAGASTVAEYQQAGRVDELREQFAGAGT